MDYYGKMRTNWFTITDKQRLLDLVEKLEGEGLKIRRKNNSVCITCLGQIYFDERDISDSDFYVHMQSIIAEDDAMVVTEIGSEGTRYFCAYADIITRKDITYIDLQRQVEEKVSVLLWGSWSGSFCY